jgi:hypothetical protein
MSTIRKRKEPTFKKRQPFTHIVAEEESAMSLTREALPEDTSCPSST